MEGQCARFRVLVPAPPTVLADASAFRDLPEMRFVIQPEVVKLHVSVKGALLRYVLRTCLMLQWG